MSTPEIFYSWQSDLPAHTNLDLIEAALGRIVQGAHANLELPERAAVQSAVAGMHGSPDITRAIFDRIDACAVFVADVSFINGRNGDVGFINGRTGPEGIESSRAPRLVPNPNVMLELGYALRARPESQIICVMNTAFGPVSELPFDLRNRLILLYSMAPEDDANAASEELAKVLEKPVHSALLSPTPSREMARVLDSVEGTFGASRSQNRVNISFTVVNNWVNTIRVRLESVSWFSKKTGECGDLQPAPSSAGVYRPLRPDKWTVIPVNSGARGAAARAVLNVHDLPTAGDWRDANIVSDRGRVRVDIKARLIVSKGHDEAPLEFDTTNDTWNLF